MIGRFMRKWAGWDRTKRSRLAVAVCEAARQHGTVALYRVRDMQLRPQQ